MDKITDTIAIGNFKDALDKDMLTSEGIRSVLGMVPTLAEVEPDEHGLDELETFDFIDGKGNRYEDFTDALDVLEDMQEHSPPTLVHCHAGRSRSVVVVAGHLMKTLGLSPSGALAMIAAKRETHVMPGLMGLLNQLQAELAAR